MNVCAGIFVGGRARRMNGAPKGLLVAPSGETIVARWSRIFSDLGIPYVLVGAHRAYAGLGVIALEDDESAEGPLAGLLALLEHAGDRRAVAVACDMPYVAPGLVERLIAAPSAPIVAARRSERWEPFFARYETGSVLPVARARAARGDFALQGLLDACGAAELVLDAGEEGALRDWDTPEDLVASPRSSRSPR